MSEVLGPELVLGAVFGLVAASAFVLVPSLQTAWPAVLAAVVILALLVVDDAPLSLAVGVAVAIGAGFLPNPPLRVALGAGGTVISMATLSDQVSAGTRFVLAAVAVGAGVALADLEHRRGPALVATLGVGTLVGMFLTVPDTELVLLVLAVVLPTAVLALRDPARTGSRGAIALLAVVLWVVAEGGQGRPGSIVGAVACLGVLVLEPAVHRLFDHDSPGPPDGVLVLVQVVVVVFAARVAGFREGTADAALLAVIALFPAAWVLFVATRRSIR